MSKMKLFPSMTIHILNFHRNLIEGLMCNVLKLYECIHSGNRYVLILNLQDLVPKRNLEYNLDYGVSTYSFMILLCSMLPLLLLSCLVNCSAVKHASEETLE